MKDLISEKLFEVKKTARYFTLGDFTEHTKTVWFVCHGYGQLARYFIPKFDSLIDGQTFIIAPEAFHRFYLNGFDGKVGASWMTKEDRLNDIFDYVQFLDSLYDNILTDFPSNDIKINVLGFSQGAATVCRWVENENSKFDNLILWSGLFPPDIDLHKIKALAKSLKIYLVYGSDDEFLKSEDFNSSDTLLLNNEIPFQKIVFKGNHVIDYDALVQLKNNILHT